MVNNVLVPTDGSEQADGAFEFALETFPEAEITVLYALDPPETGYRTGKERGTQHPDSDFQTRVKEHTEFLEEYVESGDKAGVVVTPDHTVAYERGREARAILDYLDDHQQFDLVVMGSHGRTGASRILLGSVAEAVVRRAPIPVTVVR